MSVKVDGGMVDGTVSQIWVSFAVLNCFCKSTISIQLIENTHLTVNRRGVVRDVLSYSPIFGQYFG